MSEERVEAQRVLPATPAVVFAVLRDPWGHVAIDGSGMLMAATGEPVSAVGDSFVVHMDREALGDRPLGRYDVTVRITAYEPDREIAWTVIGGIAKPPIGHVYGYRLEPATTDDGAPATLVTSSYDWSGIDPVWRGRIEFPIVPPGALATTLGILERTVRFDVRRAFPSR